MVEQWTENPCVPGSIPGGTTNAQMVKLVDTLDLNPVNRNVRGVQVPL
jgi:hypothetical protein